MDNPIVKILRFLIFFPICFIAMAIVYWGLGNMLIWLVFLFGLSKFWFFVVIIILGGVIWGLFKVLAFFLVMLAAFISPIKWLGILTISILTFVNSGFLVYNIWTDYSGFGTFGAVIATLLVIEITFVLIFGTKAASLEHY